MTTPDQPIANPYAAPDPVESPPFELDGALLVVSKKAELPNYCIYTGEPTRWVHRTGTQLVWYEKWYKGKSCVVVMSVTWPFRIRAWGWMLGIALVFTLLFVAIGLMSLRWWWAPFAFIPFLCFGFGKLIELVKRKSGLKVVRYEDERFWIEGFSPEFLERLKSLSDFAQPSKADSSSLPVRLDRIFK